MLWAANSFSAVFFCAVVGWVVEGGVAPDWLGFEPNVSAMKRKRFHQDVVQ